MRKIGSVAIPFFNARPSFNLLVSDRSDVDRESLMPASLKINNLICSFILDDISLARDYSTP
jgi:hypothetical protein